MILQVYKYFISRLGLSVILAASAGFSALYFLHEIALPGEVLDDEMILSAAGLLGAFCGFVLPGMVGERRCSAALRKLEHIAVEADREEMIGRFERLLALTGSGYFLPARGSALRELALRAYAEYLLSIGQETAEAMKVYLRVYLQDPEETRFRAPLLAGLGRFEDFGPEELNLLLLLLQANKYNDAAMVRQLADFLLRRGEVSAKLEPVYLRAMENGHAKSAEIAGLLAPRMLEQSRMDETALKVYLLSLPFDPPQAGKLREFLANAYCEDRWRDLNPDLHRECGKVYEQLTGELKDSIHDSARERNDESEQAVHAVARQEKKYIAGFVRHAGSAFFTGAWSRFQERPPLYRLAWLAAPVLVAVVSLMLSVAQRRQPVEVPPPPPPKPAVPAPAPERPVPGTSYMVQLAAVQSENQADRIMQKLKDAGVPGLHMVKTQRDKGDKWFKIRSARFSTRQAAEKFADDLVARKLIQNYFIFPIKGSSSPSSGGENSKTSVEKKRAGEKNQAEKKKPPAKAAR